MISQKKEGVALIGVALKGLTLITEGLDTEGCGPAGYGLIKNTLGPIISTKFT